MVNKEDIELIFNNVLNKEYEYKSHQHLTIRNASIVSTMDSFHEKTCGKKIRKTELGIVIDANGNNVYEQKGTKNEVPFDERKIHDCYDEYGELHIEHNHPRGDSKIIAECLSGADVSYLFQTYRPYGKRPDGSEGYLVGEEGVYPIKSVTCESANGSRMTLVRGDKFKHENEFKAKQLGGRLERYFLDYIEKFSDTRQEVMYHVNGNNYVDSSNFDDWNIYKEECNKKIIKEIGAFQENKEFKDIQKEFRELDCKLTMSFPFDYEFSS